MRIFLLKGSIFFLIALFAYLAWAFIPTFRYSFSNGDTESNLLIIPKNTSFDVLFMGASHARIFSRTYNHQRVEAILGTSFLNISKGGGAGVVPEKMYLDYFYTRGNDAELIVYFIDPYVLYSSKWNEDLDFLSDEPLSLSFFLRALENGVSAETLENYLKSKLSLAWLHTSPDIKKRESRSLQSVDVSAVEKRIASVYPDGRDKEAFTRYEEKLEELIALAEEHGTRIIFVIPTTLLGGDVPGKAELIELLRGYKEERKILYYDYSSAVTDPALYMDHDHLNSIGIEYFTRQYLLPIISSVRNPE